MSGARRELKKGNPSWLSSIANGIAGHKIQDKEISEYPDRL